jgi:hypothetical protein
MSSVVSARSFNMIKIEILTKESGIIPPRPGSLDTNSALAESNSNCRHEISHGAPGSLNGSEDPLGLSVNLLERESSAFVEDVFGWEALVFIVVVCVHAVSELFHLILTELVENGLTGGALILSGETICKFYIGQNPFLE